jgi:HEPN domain-containing protein
LAGREFAFSGSRNLDAIGMLLQQAVEKLMKAVLIDRGVKAPKVHDLELLDRLLGTARVGPCGSPSDLAKLSAAAVESRYPGAWVTTQDAVDLMRIATSIWTMLRPLV